MKAAFCQTAWKIHIKRTSNFWENNQMLGCRRSNFLLLWNGRSGSQELLATDLKDTHRYWFGRSVIFCSFTFLTSFAQFYHVVKNTYYSQHSTQFTEASNGIRSNFCAFYWNLVPKTDLNSVLMQKKDPRGIFFSIWNISSELFSSEIFSLYLVFPIVQYFQ